MPAATVAPAARVRGLSKRYGDKVVLDEVDLELAPGELRGLLGPNGAGKTTLLRMLFGLVRRDAGSVELLGRPLPAGRRLPLTGVAGFVEEPAFYNYLSGRANLELLAELDDAAPDGIDAVLERVALLDRSRDRVGAYSTGMRQRLGIAAALLRDPKLLLLDEPTSGLDPAGVREVSALLRDLSAQGVAAIVSSHQIGGLEPICHSYTMIRSGRVVWDGDASQVDAEAPGSVYLLVTSDDLRAVEIGGGRKGLAVGRSEGTSGIRVAVEPGALDGYVSALIYGGVAVRRLELLVSPLQSMFFALTGDDDTADRRSWITAQAAARTETAVTG
ncbi:MAG: ABC transporter ATP-binding protein [Solirubrobacteraceae bacterium]